MRSIVLALTLVVGSAVPALGESTKDELDRARARLEQLRRSADATTERYETALQRLARLDARIRETEQAITRMDTEAARLRKEIIEQAVAAYVGADRNELGGSALDQADVMDSVRATILMGSANRRSLDTGDALSALLADVERRRDALAGDREEQGSLTKQIEREQAALAEELSETAELEERLEIRLTEEQAAARRAQQALAAQRAAAARQAAEQAASTPSDDSGSSGSSGGGGGGGVIAQPTPGGGMLGVEVCPIQGPLSFVDSWHAPRSGGRLHQGVDLMTSYGSPNVAVTSGTVSQSEGALQGNGVYLYGDNGNTYYYFHLSSYGASGRVSAGQVVGYSGDTGNARGGPIHTHFEIHPGGGAAVNPTAAVAAVC